MQNMIPTRLLALVEKYQDTYLRIALAIIYIWFGILKPFDLSPANELATKTISFIPPHTFILILGIWEIVIGLSFLYHPFTRFAVAIFFLHVTGTFLPLITLPHEVYTRIPYAPTLEGQYIIKNLATIGVVLTIWLNYEKHHGSKTMQM